MNTEIEDGEEVDGFCPDCLDSYGEPTGLLLSGLRVECPCTTEYCAACNGRGWNPPSDETATDKLIAVLEAKGFTVRYNYNGSRRWGVTWALQWYGADTLPKAALLAVQAVEESQ